MATIVERTQIDTVLREYSAQGWHRTATDVDNRSAAWLADQVRARGVEPEFEEFTIDRVDPLAAYLEVGGQRIEGLPLFDGGFTGPYGVVGSFGTLGSAAAVGLTDTAQNSAALQALTQQRRNSPHRAIVVAALGGRPGLAASNATAFAAPYGPPVLQVAGEERDRLQRWAAEGRQVRAVVHAVRTPAPARNVLAVIAGSDPERAPIGVVTPRSGWWSCAAERGGGIACWLEILRAVQHATPVRTVQFVATSGHELDFLGFETYLLRRPAAATAAAFWLHLGMNIGAADPNQGVLRATDAALLALAVEALAAHRAGPYSSVPVGAPPFGEASNLARRGGRYISLVGPNACFHLPSDTYPEAVNGESISRYAAALAELIVRLATTRDTVPGDDAA